MAILKLYSDNPKDGITSFDKIRVQAREFERRFTDMKKILKDNAMASLN